MKQGILIAMLVAILAGLISCAPAPENRVLLVIRFEASDQGLGEFKSIMDGVSEAMAGEPGFVSAKVYPSVDDSNVFLLQEVWDSKEEHLEHFDRINGNGDWAYINTLLVVEPQLEYYAAK